MEILNNGPDEFFDPDYDRIFVGKGKKWAGCEYISFNAIRNWTAFKCGVWRNEGQFDRNGKFQFNEKFENYEPLLIDLNTAKLVSQMYDLVGAETRLRIEKLCENRSQFIQLGEFCWSKARF